MGYIEASFTAVVRPVHLGIFKFKLSFITHLQQSFVRSESVHVPILRAALSASSLYVLPRFIISLPYLQVYKTSIGALFRHYYDDIVEDIAHGDDS